MDKRDSLSPVRRELLRIGTGRIPPSMPHPVLLAACEKNKQTKNPTMCITGKGQKLHMTILGEQEAFYFPFLGREECRLPPKPPTSRMQKRKIISKHQTDFSTAELTQGNALQK